ncbi:phosphoglycerate mutase-like protein [Trichodelitschia bisporula]|uniref:Phosphoglycerate mutase-like protein n=1 Tax=Trichodelitschia bisporula TaxID=703511 RepID=A0A6G1HKQ7_9PEZI|nr:phosphoglycerate mutase-like protein [Trichodelitschia bisporula]
MRHGERSPVSPRFQNAGLAPFWPYCNAARFFTSAIMSQKDWSEHTMLPFQRRLETFGRDDLPVPATGPNGETHGICQPGELTDVGRQTTLALGERLRRLYVEQLSFLPAQIENADAFYLRTTPIPRALESMQQAFTGMYPPGTRAADFPPPPIITRSPADETLFPNDSNCRRFAHLSRAFAQRAAERWNDTPEMEYLNKVLGKWMPAESKRIAVDSRPRLSGIMDTINATAVHGPETKLPKEFYDPQAAEIIDKVAMEEWYAGYGESREYRALGIGALAGDMVGRMVGNSTGELGATRFAISGCHDTTLAGFLSGLGAFDGEKWPPFTSHIAVELLRVKKDAAPEASKSTGWFGLFGKKSTSLPVRKRSEELTDDERAKLDGYFVRVRYNDRVMTVPGCRKEGNHREGDESLCTLSAFKAIVDKFTPLDWKAECSANVKGPAFPPERQPAGY